MTAQAVAAPPDAPECWLTPAEAATRLRVSVNTVIRWFHAGYIPGLREGSLYRISAAFIAAMVEAGRSARVDIADFARQWAAT